MQGGQLTLHAGFCLLARTGASVSARYWRVLHQNHKPHRQLPCLRLFNCFANLALLFVLLLLLLLLCCCTCPQMLSIWLCFLAQTRGFLLFRTGRGEEAKQRRSNCRIFLCFTYLCYICAGFILAQCLWYRAAIAFLLRDFYYFYCLRDAWQGAWQWGVGECYKHLKWSKWSSTRILNDLCLCVLLMGAVLGKEKLKGATLMLEQAAR